MLKKIITVICVLVCVLLLFFGFFFWQAFRAQTTAENLAKKGDFLEASRVLASNPAFLFPSSKRRRIKKKVYLNLFKMLLKHARHFERDENFRCAVDCINAARYFAEGKKQKKYLRSVLRRLQNSIKVRFDELEKEFSASSSPGQKRRLACELLDLKSDGKARSASAWTNSSGIEFTYIPAGVFLMGSANSFPKDSLALHPVHIAKGIYISKYEISQNQCTALGITNNSAFNDGLLPAVNLSWDEAQQVVNALDALPESKQQSILYRLPTEAEWEYICKAGSQPVRGGNFNIAEFFVRNGSLLPVTQTKPNIWGVCGMRENVSEWCLDRYAADFYMKAVFSQPENLSFGSKRCIRGGAWRFAKRYSKPFYRFKGRPGARFDSVGLRLVAQRSFKE